jgi:opacity protein-like surface antigen
MSGKTFLVALVVLTTSASLGRAQDPRLELGGSAGWTFADGVSGNRVDVPGVGSFDRIDPKDSFSWNARLGYNVTSNVEVGFLFDQQATDLEIGGTSTVTLGSLNVNNYHGYFAYNFGDSDARTRPYLLLGLGATQYGTIGVSVAGTQHDISGNSRFSGTLAGGVKLFPGPRFGLRLEARWTPTYIKSDNVGWWCDPFWGCYVVGNAQYANQFEMTGGVILRF